MNISKLSKSLVLGVAVLLASSAFAANKGSLQLNDAVTVSGTQLKPGDYSVKWDGTGANVQLSIMKGSKVVATAPAHMIDLNQKPTNDSAVVRNNADGSRTLAEIHFGGKKAALAIGSESSANYGSN